MDRGERASGRLEQRARIPVDRVGEGEDRFPSDILCRHPERLSEPAGVDIGLGVGGAEGVVPSGTDLAGVAGYVVVHEHSVSYLKARDAGA